MKKLSFTLAMAISSLIAYADCEVYLFQSYQANTDNTIFIDGNEVGKLNGPFKKKTEIASFATPMVENKKAFRKLILPSDERITVTLQMEYTIPMSAEKTIYKGEVSIEGENGEVYYYEVKSNGKSDMRLVPLEDKKAKKFISKHKDWIQLDPITVK